MRFACGLALAACASSAAPPPQIVCDEWRTLSSLDWWHTPCEFAESDIAAVEWDRSGKAE